MPAEQQIPAGYASCVLAGNLSVGTEIFNLTFGIEFTAEPWTAADTEALYDDLVVPMASETNVNWSYEKLTVRLQGLAGDLQQFEHVERTQGSRVAASEPGNIATLIRKRSNLAGRRYRGRWYWPGLLSDADVDEAGGILSTRVTAIQADMDTILANVIAHANVDNMVILHAWDPEDPPPVTPGPTTVVVLQVDNLIATQRRRISRLRS